MVARVQTVAFQGIDVVNVDVQVQMVSGLPAFTIVGLPDKAVGESRERVRSALHAIGLALPPKRITINLSPADLQKEGSHYDLPIAIGLLVCLGVLPRDEMQEYISLGELALDGGISTVLGSLPAAINASAQGKGLICPEACGTEAAWAEDISILAPASLLALINHFKGSQVLSPPEPSVEDIISTRLDLKDIKGQETAKRALEVAAAGGHNMLMIGPPGSGKSMLAARLPTILPELSPSEALEVTMIHSVAGQLDKGKLLRNRPFRDPHHSASLPSLVGGGLKAKPGEISLAHMGVLFLDELPEFNRATIEALRQPLETGKVSIARANAHTTYPARTQLIAAMNPCPCGHIDDPERTCSRAPKCALSYQSKISGPMFDRMDIHIDVPAVMASDLSLPPASEDSAIVRARVTSARTIQNDRYKSKGIRTNAEADGETLTTVATPSAKGQTLLDQAAQKMKLSARGYNRVLRVARTLADLAAQESVTESHVAEALSYRRLNVYD